MRGDTMNEEKRNHMFTTVVALLIVLMCGCISGFDENREAEKRSIVDDLGRTVFVPDNPQRILSLAPSVTEILFILGLENQIVGVDDNSDYPEAAKDKEKVGGWIPDEERIMALRPDLVLVSDMTSQAIISSLEDRGLIVVCLAPKTVEGVIQNIRLVGLITGKEDAAQMIAEGLEQRIEAITSVTASQLYRPSVYLEYYPYWTFGPGSFGNDLIVMAGGINIAADTATEYPNISGEYIVGKNPEIIIFTVGHGTTTTVDDIRDRPGFDTIDAVKNNRIHTIDDDILSRPGPRIVDALEQLAYIIHPELFPQSRDMRLWCVLCLC